MRDLDRALLDINFVREHIARTTQFKGYGPLTLAATGFFSLGVAALEAQLPARSHGRALEFIATWTATAAVAVLLIGIEAIVRSRKLHVGMAVEMLQAAIEQFLPAVTAGVLIAFALARWSPSSLWMLPGLWQIVFSLGVFSTARILPKVVFIVDKNGQLISASGDVENIDTTSLASLTAGNIAATGGMAKLLKENEFATQFHEGESQNIHIQLVGNRVILVVIFDSRSSLGLVRLLFAGRIRELLGTGAGVGQRLVVGGMRRVGLFLQTFRRRQIVADDTAALGQNRTDPRQCEL